ncbi:MAG TPA: glycosyltransferase family 9 protein [Gemmatimonadaceae bacterium]|nr:glycosyltransferase family 9 protein [Gemmatimonadaceae bacterium]
MSEPPMDRICIVMMSAVGDAVHVLPVVNAIKRARPSSHITWVLQPGPATLVRGHPAIDDIILFDRSKGMPAVQEVISQLRSRTFDLLIDLQVYFKAGVITAFSGAPRRLGFDRARARDANWLFTTERIPPHPVQHVQDQYFEFLRYLGIDPEPVMWGIGPAGKEVEWQKEFISGFDRPIASIVVATSKPEKDWMPERWASICEILYDRYGLQPVLVGGDSQRERDAVAVITSSGKGKARSALGSGLRNLVSILDASELVLAPDTGPLHIAVALGRPVISLMGYTDPRRTGPYRRFHDLLIDAFHEPGETQGPVTMETKRDRMQRISVDDVSNKIETWAQVYRGKS